MEGDFDSLDPYRICSAVERVFGLSLNGTVEPFNSYVNRVYGLEDEDGGKWVAKFYRPGRWTTEAIEEEHDLLFAAAEADIPTAVPELDAEGFSLHRDGNLRFALFPRKSGRTYDSGSDEDLVRIGSLIGRFHLACAGLSFQRRLSAHPASSTRRFLDELRDAGVVHPDLAEDFFSLADDLVARTEAAFDEVQPAFRTLHGDVHRGNILDRMDQGLMLIDFDDAMSGPAVQDLWMLASDRLPASYGEWDLLLSGYEQFCPFNHRELELVEQLRFMRMMYYLAWQCRQRNDRRFLHENPDWGGRAFWIRELEDLREQARHFSIQNH